MLEFSSLNYSLKLLSKRDMSVGEIRDKLERKKFSQSDIAKTIAILLDKNFLNDERYAKNITKSLMQYNLCGRYRIRQRLLKKKIPTEIINSEISKIAPIKEEENAVELAKKYISKRVILPEKKYEKVGRFLVGRGFSWEIVKDVLDRINKKD